MEKITNVSDDYFGDIKSYPEITLPTTENVYLHESVATTNTTNSSLFYYIVLFILGCFLVLIIFSVVLFLLKGIHGFYDSFQPVILSILQIIGYDVSDIITDTAGHGYIDKTNIIKGYESSSSLKKTNVTDEDTNKEDDDETPLVTSSQQENKEPDGYSPDDSNSSIQKKGKSGYCYIGTSQNTRTCANIDASDTCMSGDIFPTMELCVNPNLK